MSVLFFIALVLLIIFLSRQLKDIVTTIIIASLLLFAFVLVTAVFANANSFQIVMTLAATIVILAAIIFPLAHFQNKSWQKQKKDNDEYGHQIWLKAEAKRQAERESNQS